MPTRDLNREGHQQRQGVLGPEQMLAMLDIPFPRAHPYTSNGNPGLATSGPWGLSSWTKVSAGVLPLASIYLGAKAQVLSAPATQTSYMLQHTRLCPALGPAHM